MIFCVEDDNNIRDLLVYTLEPVRISSQGLRNSPGIGSPCRKKDRADSS